MPTPPRRSPLQALYGVYAAVVITLSLAIVAAPVMALLPGLQRRRAFGRQAIRLSMCLVGVPLRLDGLARIPDRTCIAVSNHASYIDGVVLTAALPGNFTFVVQDGAANWPVIGFIIRRMGVSFVNRSSVREGARQTRELLRRVANGESLAIFAEGTFRDQPGLLPFKRGAFLMATRAGVPVLPVVIRGSRQFFGGGLKLPMWHPIEIEILAPLAPRGPAQDMLDAARREIAKRCGEPDLDQDPQISSAEPA